MTEEKSNHKKNTDNITTKTTATKKINKMYKMKKKISYRRLYEDLEDGILLLCCFC
jgi:hypothetical protein